MSKNKDQRARTWTSVVYPESAPKNWREILASYHVPWVESPLHDKDVNPDGEVKKAHWHVVLFFDGKKSFEQIKEITDALNASKGLQRSLFGYFRQVLIYKAGWYDKEVVLADKYYPSTQRCSDCGHIKTGDEKISLDGNQKYKTKHNEYICYECGAVMDRDENAVKNLLALIG